MKKITAQALDAFINARKFKKDNMTIEVQPNVTVMRLYGHPIAYLYNDPERTLSISACGWLTNTTKERLNALPGVHINQKNWRWYLNGMEWDGKLVDVNKLGA
jgi:predicted DNA-binding protein (MmcQ/YjbR family)